MKDGNIRNYRWKRKYRGPGSWHQANNKNRPKNKKGDRQWNIQFTVSLFLLLFIFSDWCYTFVFVWLLFLMGLFGFEKIFWRTGKHLMLYPPPPFILLPVLAPTPRDPDKMYKMNESMNKWMDDFQALLLPLKNNLSSQHFRYTTYRPLWLSNLFKY